MSAPLPDYYNILGVDRTCDESAIKKAYKKLALKYHPDKNPDAEAHDKFKSVVSAYNVLSNQADRRKYDLTRPVSSSTRPFTDYQGDTTPKFTSQPRQPYNNYNSNTSGDARTSSQSYSYTTFTHPHSSGSSTFQGRFNDRGRFMNPFFQTYFNTFRTGFNKPRHNNAYDNFDNMFAFSTGMGGLDPDGSIPPRWSRSRNYDQTSGNSRKTAFKNQPHSESSNNANFRKSQNQYQQEHPEPRPGPSQGHHSDNSTAYTGTNKYNTERNFGYKDTNNDAWTQSTTGYSYASTKTPRDKPQDTSSERYKFGSTQDEQTGAGENKRQNYQDFTDYSSPSGTADKNNLFSEDGPSIKFAVPDPTNLRTGTASKSSRDNISNNRGVKNKAFSYDDDEVGHEPTKRRNIFVPPKGSGGIEGMLNDDDYDNYINNKNNNAKGKNNFQKVDFIDLTDEVETPEDSGPAMKSSAETDSSATGGLPTMPNLGNNYESMNPQYSETEFNKPNARSQKRDSPIVLESDEDEEFTEGIPSSKKPRTGSVFTPEPNLNETRSKADPLKMNKMSLDDFVNVPPLSQTFGNFDMRNILNDIQTHDIPDSPMSADIPGEVHSSYSSDNTDELRRDLTDHINETGKRPNTLFSAVNSNKRYAHHQSSTTGSSGTTLPKSNASTTDLQNNRSILLLIPPAKPAALSEPFSEIELAEYGKLMEIYQNSWNDYVYKISQYYKNRAESDRKFSLELLKTTDGTERYIKALKLDQEVKGNWAKSISDHLDVMANYLEIRKKIEPLR